MRRQKIPSPKSQVPTIGTVLVIIALSACTPATPVPTTTTPGIDPTHFIETRVAQILTEDAVVAVATVEPTATPRPTLLIPTVTPFLSPTSAPTFTPEPTNTEIPTTPTRTPVPTISLGAFPTPPVALQGEPHLWLIRPLSEGNVFPASAYRYGSTFENQLRTHHGLDFSSNIGTPVIAVAGGTVYYAGPDTERAFGPFPNFYGNVVVIQLAQTWQGHTVYALVGHLSEVLAQTGQSLNAGDVVGKVGATGIAFGPHLHLEVRLDHPDDYYSTANPELWLIPANGAGAIAVRVSNTNNRYLPGMRVNLFCADGAKRFLDTYWEAAVNPDLQYGENAAMNDIPAGFCTIDTKFGETVISQTVALQAGTTNFVWLKP